MQLTEIKIHPVKNENDRILAFATITFDDVFVVHNLRIINGKKGVFVAMPDRELKYPCQSCQKKNPYQAKHCMFCGAALEQLNDQVNRFEDIVHPINPDFRKYLNETIIAEFTKLTQPV